MFTYIGTLNVNSAKYKEVLKKKISIVDGVIFAATDHYKL